MNILGIDPGLQRTGWAVIKIKNRSFYYVDANCIKTKASDDMQARLLQIYLELTEVIKQYTPYSAAIEETYVNNNFGSSLKLAQARAAAFIATGNVGVKLFEYPAKTIKKTLTGSGTADKEQITRMISLLIPRLELNSHDAADALATAICHANHSLLI